MVSAKSTIEAVQHFKNQERVYDAWSEDRGVIHVAMRDYTVPDSFYQVPEGSGSFELMGIMPDYLIDGKEKVVLQYIHTDRLDD